MKQNDYSVHATPSVYLSTSGGKFRVINQGMPISADKKTAAEALLVAKQFKLDVGSLIWDGDTGEFVKSKQSTQANF